MVRRSRLLVAFVQTASYSVRFDIENAKATDDQRAMFERMQRAIAEIYFAAPQALKAGE